MISSENELLQSQTAITRTIDVTIRIYGKEHIVSVDPEETILMAAIRQNIDPPYACQIGACCTCRALKVEGEIFMDEREGLSDSEMEEGYVLTCQSHPLTSNVVVDYDQ